MRSNRTAHADARSIRPSPLFLRPVTDKTAHTRIRRLGFVSQNGFHPAPRLVGFVSQNGLRSASRAASLGSFRLIPRPVPRSPRFPENRPRCQVPNCRHSSIQSQFPKDVMHSRPPSRLGFVRSFFVFGARFDPDPHLPFALLAGPAASASVARVRCRPEPWVRFAKRSPTPPPASLGSSRLIHRSVFHPQPAVLRPTPSILYDQQIPKNSCISALGFFVTTAPTRLGLSPVPPVAPPRRQVGPRPGEGRRCQFSDHGLEQHPAARSGCRRAAKARPIQSTHAVRS